MTSLLKQIEMQEAKKLAEQLVSSEGLPVPNDVPFVPSEGIEHTGLAEAVGDIRQQLSNAVKALAEAPKQLDVQFIERISSIESRLKALEDDAATLRKMMTDVLLRNGGSSG